MDRKSVIALILCLLALFASQLIVPRLFPPVAAPERASSPGTNSATIGPGDTNIAAIQTMSGAGSNSMPSAGQPSFALARSVGASETITLENANARYVFTPLGGGIERIELKNFPAVVTCGANALTPTNMVSMTNQFAVLNEGALTPVGTLLGSAALLGDGWFTPARIDGGVRFEKSLTNGLHLVKEFRLGTNYVVETTVTLENNSSSPVLAPEQEFVIGTAEAMGLRDESLVVGLQWYNGSSAQEIGSSWFANRKLFVAGTPRTIYEGGASNVYWASTHSQFFAIAAIPVKPPAPAKLNGTNVVAPARFERVQDDPAPRIVARKVDLPPAPEWALAADSRVVRNPAGFQTAFQYPATLLAPGQKIIRNYDIYAGPKAYNTLTQVHPESNLDLIMKFGTFGFFAKALLLCMDGLHGIGIAYGLAIVVITLVIRATFWPLTMASTRSMKRMSVLQPQMKALQEKYKDDPKKMNLKLMEFMRENKVSPVAGCLPLLIQLPILFGFYTMLRSAIELRGAHFLWACDLSQPDTIFVIPGLGFIPFFGVAKLGLPINPLPLLMGVTMLWQARLTPPAPGMDPTQQKMMRYMPLLFLGLFYNYSAGLSLYQSVQNLLSIAQMKMTRTDPKKAVALVPDAGKPKKRGG